MKELLRQRRVGELRKADSRREEEEEFVVSQKAENKEMQAQEVRFERRLRPDQNRKRRKQCRKLLLRSILLIV